jgi:hypothetical protein
MVVVRHGIAGHNVCGRQPSPQVVAGSRHKTRQTKTSTENLENLNPENKSLENQTLKSEAVAAAMRSNPGTA